MDKFDHYIKHDLRIRYYGRYVDDFIIVHNSNEYLRDLVKTIKGYLKNELYLSVHPKKVHLQHYSKGVKFLGTVLKSNRIYIDNRTKSNFYQAIQKQNEIAKNHKPSREAQVMFQSRMNPYLGILKHYKTYRMRKKMLWKYLSPYWWSLAYLSGGYAKFVLKTRRGSDK